MTTWTSLVDALELMERSKWADDEPIVEVNLANAITMLVLGLQWFNKFGKLGSRPDPWMMNGNDAWLAAHPIIPDVRRLVFQWRMIRLGNALGTIMVKGTANGTYGLLERLRSRQDTRSAFLENEITAMLLKNGAEVEVVKESGTKGQDFDLLVTHKGVQISVEITATSVPVPTPKAIINKLKEKVEQVPRDRPAVLYLHIPPVWMRPPYGKLVLSPPITKFIRNSHRFNIIVLVWEDVLPSLTADGGFPEMNIIPIYSHVARHSLSDVSVFTPTSNRDDNLRTSLRLIEIVKDYRDRVKAKAVGYT